MDSIDEDRLRLYLEEKLPKICDADPVALAAYIVAILQKESSFDELKTSCLEKLQEFLEDNTSSFVADLFRWLTTAQNNMREAAVSPGASPSSVDSRRSPHSPSSPRVEETSSHSKSSDGGRVRSRDQPTHSQRDRRDRGGKRGRETDERTGESNGQRQPSSRARETSAAESGDGVAAMETGEKTISPGDESSPQSPEPGQAVEGERNSDKESSAKRSRHIESERLVQRDRPVQRDREWRDRESSGSSGNPRGGKGRREGNDGPRADRGRSERDENQPAVKRNARREGGPTQPRDKDGRGPGFPPNSQGQDRSFLTIPLGAGGGPGSGLLATSKAQFRSGNADHKTDYDPEGRTDSGSYSSFGVGGRGNSNTSAISPPVFNSSGGAGMSPTEYGLHAALQLQRRQQGQPPSQTPVSGQQIRPASAPIILTANQPWQFNAPPSGFPGGSGGPPPLMANPIHIRDVGAMAMERFTPLSQNQMFFGRDQRMLPPPPPTQSRLAGFRPPPGAGDFRSEPNNDFQRNREFDPPPKSSDRVRGDRASRDRAPTQASKNVAPPRAKPVSNKRTGGKKGSDLDGVEGLSRSNAPSLADGARRKAPIPSKSASEPVAPNSRVYVNNLEERMNTIGVLNSRFQAFGTIVNIRTMPDKMCAFIDFASEAVAASVVAQRSISIDGINCSVNFSKGDARQAVVSSQRTGDPTKPRKQFNPRLDEQRVKVAAILEEKNEKVAAILEEKMKIISIQKGVYDARRQLKEKQESLFQSIRETLDLMESLPKSPSETPTDAATEREQLEAKVAAQRAELAQISAELIAKKNTETSAVLPVANVSKSFTVSPEEIAQAAAKAQYEAMRDQVTRQGLHAPPFKSATVAAPSPPPVAVDVRLVLSHSDATFNFPSVSTLRKLFADYNVKDIKSTDESNSASSIFLLSFLNRSDANRIMLIIMKSGFSAATFKCQATVSLVGVESTIRSNAPTGPGQSHRLGSPRASSLVKSWAAQSVTLPSPSAPTTPPAAADEEVPVEVLAVEGTGANNDRRNLDSDDD